MPNEPSMEVITKLRAATAAMKKSPASAEAPPPPRLKESTAPDSSSDAPGAAGNATAKYLLVDHFFGDPRGPSGDMMAPLGVPRARASRAMNKACRKWPSRLTGWISLGTRAMP